MSSLERPHDEEFPGLLAGQEKFVHLIRADEMKLKVGDEVSAIIKSTEVMLEKD